MKKKISSIALAVSIVLSLSACGGPRMISLEPEANGMWCGKPHAAIINEYGAPNREMSDGMGGKILVYEHTETTVTTTADNNACYGGIYEFYYGFSPIRNTTYRTETETKTDYANFYVDGNGVCYKVETNLVRPETKYEKAARTGRE